MTGRDGEVAILSAPMRRREFLALLAAVAASGLSPVLRAAVPPDVSAVAIDPAILTDPEAAARFGRAYLAAHPDEADPDWLMHQLEATVLSGTDSAPETAEAMFRRFERSVRAEYADGVVVLVDGWLVSRSEARLYALSVLDRAQERP